MREKDDLGSLLCERENCWISPTSILGEANDLYIGGGKTIFVELNFRKIEAHERLLSHNDQ